MADDIQERIKQRTKQFALDCIELIKALPSKEPGPTVAKQLAKSSMSVAANYRACRRSRSHTEFTSRVATVAEEADESLHWLEVVRDAKLLESQQLMALLKEANELTAIFSAQLKTARKNERGKPRVKRDRNE